MISEKPSEAEVRKKIKTRLINRGPRTKQKTMLTALWIGEYQFFFFSSYVTLPKKRLSIYFIYLFTKANIFGNTALYFVFIC